jgi:hypothetical protein
MVRPKRDHAMLNSINITHGYSSTYTVNSYQSNLKFDGNGYFLCSLIGPYIKTCPKHFDCNVSSINDKRTILIFSYLEECFTSQYYLSLVRGKRFKELEAAFGLQHYYCSVGKHFTDNGVGMIGDAYNLRYCPCYRILWEQSFLIV